MATEKRICKFKKEKGERCKKAALKGEEYCSVHNEQAQRDISRERIVQLNACAEFILKNMHPGMLDDFKIAAKDSDTNDIGIYLMGILNRLYKQVDYYNPDLEPEWENKIVGFNSELICKNCNRVITGRTNIRQLYCSNSCAKEAKDKSKTGVLQPSEKSRGKEEEVDAVKWEKQQMLKHEGIA